MSKYLTITIFSVLLILLVLPHVASAAVLPFNFGQDSLVPCGRQGGPDCNLCHAFILVQNIINLFLSLIILIAPVILMFGGFMILSSGGTPERTSYGKRILTHAIIALLIAFGGWMIINTVLITVAGSVEVGGQKVGQIQGFPYPWNKIKCEAVPTDDNGNESTQDEKKYCICETPVYTIDPNDFPQDSAVIAMEIKGTELTDEQACSQGCVSGNASAYCHQLTLTNLSEANLYCDSQNSLESKQAHCVGAEDISHSVEYLRKFSSQQACWDSVTPDSGNFDKECGRKCWIDGNIYCNCADRGITGYLLYRTHREKNVGTFFNAFSCIINCKYSGGRSRWGSFQEPSGCEHIPSAVWQFQGDLDGTKNQQIADATTALTNFLNCFYEKAPDNIGYISSITDIDIYKDRGQGLCNPQDCKGTTCSFDNLCGAEKACDHSCGSCHYGGTCTSTKSYAVDFGDEENVCQIADYALQCGGVNKIFGPQSCGGNVAVDGYHNDHVHISVINSCNCN